MASDPVSVRKAMKTYWDKWATYNTESGTSFEMMLLETQSRYEYAKRLSDLDRKEIVSLLPDMKNMEVLELGAGIGRFTGKLARRSKSVLATDFMEKFIHDNQELNGRKHSNVTFAQLDASKIPYPSESFDFVFSNWLLMYLGDSEVRQFAVDSLRILRDGGYLFFRESCFHTSGRIVRVDNPSMYRSIKEYQNVFSSVSHTAEDGTTYCYDFVFGGNCQTYIILKNNPSQVYWMWRKKKVVNENGTPKLVEIQRSLDDRLYSDDRMSVYENVIGDGFVTPGGLRAAKNLLSRLTFTPQTVMLDVGCGLGGTLAYMAKEHAQVDITGLELSPNAVQASILLMNQLKSNKGQVCVSDLAQTNLPDGCFDIIFVKDTIGYLGNQTNLLLNFQKWLKPRGQLLVGDYCLGNSPLTDSVAKVLTAEGIQPLDSLALSQVFHVAGYNPISCENLSAECVQFITEDLHKLEVAQNVSDMTKLVFKTIWETLLQGLETGQLQWTVLVATKPSE